MERKNPKTGQPKIVATGRNGDSEDRMVTDQDRHQLVMLIIKQVRGSEGRKSKKRATFNKSEFTINAITYTAFTPLVHLTVRLLLVYSCAFRYSVFCSIGGECLQNWICGTRHR